MRLTLAAAIMAAVSAFVLNGGSAALAAPQQLDCVLTDTVAKPGSESRPVTVIFDEAKKSLTAKEDGHDYDFSKVMITYIAISGQADDVSLGIDRSSLGIVWQHYAADKVATEFGHCRPTPTGK